MFTMKAQGHFHQGKGKGHILNCQNWIVFSLQIVRSQKAAHRFGTLPFIKGKRVEHKEVLGNLQYGSASEQYGRAHSKLVIGPLKQPSKTGGSPEHLFWKLLKWTVQCRKPIHYFLKFLLKESYISRNSYFQKYIRLLLLIFFSTNLLQLAFKTIITVINKTVTILVQ